MFERFTEEAIKVLMLAQEESRRLGHNFVGTEQILLGLIGEETGVAAKTLQSMGVNLMNARIEVEKIIGYGSGYVAVLVPFTVKAKKTLELSIDVSRQLGHSYINTEHMLLGIIRESTGVAVTVLRNLGIDPSEVRTKTINYCQDALVQKNTRNTIVNTFTKKSKNVIILAQEESRRLKHNFVGTEQILLGLIGEGTSFAAKVMESKGLNLKNVRIEVEKIIGQGSVFVSEEIPFTPRTIKLLQLSLEEARLLGHDDISPEHLLLGLISEGEGVAARTLENLGLDKSELRYWTIRMLIETDEVSNGGGQNQLADETRPLSSEDRLDKIIDRLLKMAEAPRIQQNFNADVSGVAGNVERDQNVNNAPKYDMRNANIGNMADINKGAQQANQNINPDRHKNQDLD